jgi:hypothetical protein
LSTLNPAFASKHPNQALAFDDKGGERFALSIVTVEAQWSNQRHSHMWQQRN